MSGMAEYHARLGGWMYHWIGDSVYHYCSDKKQNKVCYGTLPFGRDICRYALG